MQTRPIQIKTVVPTDDGGIKVVGKNTDSYIDKEAAKLVWRILELCTGQNSTSYIAKQLRGLTDDQTTEGIIADLVELGVLADSERLYEVFHEISSPPQKFPSHATAAQIEQNHASAVTRETGRIFALENSDWPKSGDFVELITSRHSCRSFAQQPISLQQLVSVLWCGYGSSLTAPVPSAGDLYPLHLFVVALEDQVDFPAGYYEYYGEQHELILFRDSDAETLNPDAFLHALNCTEMPFGAPAVIVITADADRQPFKYSNLGYRFMAMEIGAVAQNITLAATAAGLATCELGGVLDEAMYRELNIENQLVFLAMAIGYESGEPREDPWRITNQYEERFVGEDLPVRKVWSADANYQDNLHKHNFQFLAETQNGQITSGISTGEAEAKTKAIAEGYERWLAGQVHYDECCAAKDLSGDWLDPRQIAPLTKQQLADMPNLQPFNENLEIEWVRGQRCDLPLASVTQSPTDTREDHIYESVWVPIDLVFYPFPSDQLGRRPVSEACSSGFAAYPTYEGAVERALLEAIERDALMRFWLLQEPKMAISYNLHGCLTHGRERELEACLRDAGIINCFGDGDLIYDVVDITPKNLNGKVVVALVIMFSPNHYPHLVSGAAASMTSFEEAARKAFDEAEARLIYGLNNPTLRKIRVNEVRSPLDHELFYAQDWVEAQKVLDLIQKVLDLVNDLSSVLPPSLPKITVKWSLHRLLHELDATVVDLSEPNSPLKVVKVLSPKLIPINFGFGNEYYTHPTLPKIDPPKSPHFFA